MLKFQRSDAEPLVKPQHELRILVTIPLVNDAIPRGEGEEVRFEVNLDVFTQAVARAGGKMTIDVVRLGPHLVEVAG